MHVRRSEAAWALSLCLQSSSNLVDVDAWAGVEGAALRSSRV